MYIVIDNKYCLNKMSILQILHLFLHYNLYVVPLGLVFILQILYHLYPSFQFWMSVNSPDITLHSNLYVTTLGNCLFSRHCITSISIYMHPLLGNCLFSILCHLLPSFLSPYTPSWVSVYYQDITLPLPYIHISMYPLLGKCLF